MHIDRIRTLCTVTNYPDVASDVSRLQKIVLAFIFIFAFICSSAVPVASQTFRGTILGTVTDPNGAVIPEASVMAKNVATGIERSTITDSGGNYTISELPVGTYDVSVQKSGFQIARVTGVTRASYHLPFRPAISTNRLAYLNLGLVRFPRP